jgi:hypothetical protein
VSIKDLTLTKIFMDPEQLLQFLLPQLSVLVMYARLVFNSTPIQNLSNPGRELEATCAALHLSIDSDTKVLNMERDEVDIVRR